MNGVHHGFDCVYHLNGDNAEEENGYDETDHRNDDENVIEYHNEYYANGDGDEKEEFLKCNGGDGIVLNHFVGWYLFFFSKSVHWHAVLVLP